MSLSDRPCTRIGEHILCQLEVREKSAVEDLTQPFNRKFYKTRPVEILKMRKKKRNFSNFAKSHLLGTN